MYGYIQKLKRLPNECGDWQDKQAPDTNLQQAYGFINANSEFCVKEAYVIDNGERFKTPINLIVRNGQVVKVLTNRGSYRSIKNDMTLGERMTGDEELWHNISYDDLLNKSDLHNLINFGKTALSTGKCYFNSVMQALNAAAPFRLAVQRLSSSGVIPWQKYSWQGAWVLNEFINGIKSGGMRKYTGDEHIDDKNINRYENAIAMLATAIENMKVFKTDRDFTLHNAHLGTELINQQIEGAKATNLGKHTLREAGAKSALLMLNDIISLLGTELEYQGLDPITFTRKINTNANKTNGINRVNNSVYSGYTSYSIGNEGTDILNYIQEDLDYFNKNGKLLTQLPELLIIKVNEGDKSIHNNEPCDVYWDDEMQLRDTEGTKKYKLVSTVDKRWHYAHFVATVRTNQGWMVMDDMNWDSPIDANKYWSQNGPRRPCILVYQRCKY